MKLRMLRTLSLALAGGLLALTASTAAPAAAAAAETAYNRKTQYLNRYPIDSDPTSCVDRRIYLAAGKYQWVQSMPFNPSSNLKDYWELGEGWYSWKDCLDPQGSYPHGWYKHTSTLDPDNPNWETAVGYHAWTLSSSTTDWWGSYLIPRF